MRNNPEPTKLVESTGERVRRFLDNGGWLEGTWGYDSDGLERETTEILFRRFGRTWVLDVDPEPQFLKKHYVRHLLNVKENSQEDYNRDNAAHRENIRKTQIFSIAPYLLEMFVRSKPPMFDDILKPPFDRITFPLRLSGVPTKKEEEDLSAVEVPTNYAYPTFRANQNAEQQTLYMLDGLGVFLATDMSMDEAEKYFGKIGFQAVQIFRDIWANLCAALYCKTFLRVDVAGGRSERRHTDFNGVVEPLPYSILDLKPEVKKKYLPSLEMPVLGSEKRIVRAHWVRGHWAKYYTREGPMMKFRPPFTRGLGLIRKKKAYFAKGDAVTAVGTS